MLNVKKAVKNLIICSSLILSSQMAFATPPQQASIDQLIELSKLDSLFKSGLDQLQPFFQQEAEMIIKEITQSPTLSEKGKTAASQLTQTMTQFTQSALTDPSIHTKIRDVIKNTYTEEELKAYNAFLSTPEGQSINLKSTKVSIEIQSFMDELVQKAISNADYEKKFEEIITPLLEQ